VLVVRPLVDAFRAVRAVTCLWRTATTLPDGGWFGLNSPTRKTLEIYSEFCIRAWRRLN